MAIYHKNVRLDDGIPIGSIAPFAGNTVPPGWLECNGDTFYFKSAETGADTIYTPLYNVIGTTYGTGAMAGTFKVPDLREKFVEGASTTTGHTLGSKVDAGLPDHNHTFTGTKDQETSTDGSHNHQSGVKRIWDSLDGPWGVAQEKKSEGKYSVKRYDAGTTYYDIDYTSSSGSHSHKITAAGTIDNASKHNSVYGKSSTVQPASICMKYMIKY